MVARKFLPRVKLINPRRGAETREKRKRARAAGIRAHCWNRPRPNAARVRERPRICLSDRAFRSVLASSAVYTECRPERSEYFGCRRSRGLSTRRRNSSQSRAEIRVKRERGGSSVFPALSGTARVAQGRPRSYAVSCLAAPSPRLHGCLCNGRALRGSNSLTARRRRIERRCPSARVNALSKEQLHSRDTMFVRSVVLFL